MLIGNSEVFGANGVIRSFDPSTGIDLEPAFGAGNESDVDRACMLAQSAFDSYRETSLDYRAHFLRLNAQEIVNLVNLLFDRACAETGLPRGRNEGERGRTLGQLELFASIVSDGRWIGATLDSSLPDRKPQP